VPKTVGHAPTTLIAPELVGNRQLKADSDAHPSVANRVDARCIVRAAGQLVDYCAAVIRADNLIEVESPVYENFADTEGRFRVEISGKPAKTGTALGHGNACSWVRPFAECSALRAAACLYGPVLVDERLLIFSRWSARRILKISQV